MFIQDMMDIEYEITRRPWDEARRTLEYMFGGIARVPYPWSGQDEAARAYQWELYASVDLNTGEAPDMEYTVGRTV